MIIFAKVGSKKSVEIFKRNKKNFMRITKIGDFYLFNVGDGK